MKCGNAFHLFSACTETNCSGASFHRPSTCVYNEAEMKWSALCHCDCTSTVFTMMSEGQSAHSYSPSIFLQLCVAKECKISVLLIFRADVFD